MFTPTLCPGCTAIVIVDEHGPDRHCPCCQAAVHPAPEPAGELVPLPVRALRAEAA